ncbi:relaxase/mobilization nuclease domain-containing protein [Pedobacter namyangjuensis]|uniref:relaxase/mobilization nuclease domain-containing protein n=1 Tax=Pedobacter namyangjuensis TaxID=600626 RepID=UPI000DE4CCC9|nr:relaxase/mobilization nuclease domain-containing protein [Pedobacter namyangjuensis]
MVAKILSGKSIRGILVYNEQKVEKGVASILLASGFATDIHRLNLLQKLSRFQRLTELNPRARTNALHISLNFHAEDKLDDETLQGIALRYMEKLGFGEQPFIAYRHFDTAHTHLHIATVNIQRDGSRIDLHDIGRKVSEPIRKELEVEYGLVRAEGRRLAVQPYLKVAEYGAVPTKKVLANITKAVMQDYAYTSFAEYKAVLSQFNVQVERGSENSVMFQKKGLLYSIADVNGNPVGVPIKASAFYNGATMRNLEKHFQRNTERRKPFRQDLMERIKRVLDNYSTMRKDTMLRLLAIEQVALVLRRNQTGLIYGLTFIDHRHRTVFNGSDLGRAYAAKAITGMFSESDVPKRYLVQGESSNYLQRNEEGRDDYRKSQQGLIEGLLGRADYQFPSVIGRKRKRRKGKGKIQNLSI